MVRIRISVHSGQRKTGTRSGERWYEVNIDGWKFQSPYATAGNGFLSGDSLQYNAHAADSIQGHDTPDFESGGSLSCPRYADATISVER